ncbi:ABC transporter ATP-binding protein [Ferrimonas gelatinilytica]|uniref:ABC transporter ATP-binding protein n=1 Tax=Ferrimonas gelatinilytica TaxID=1255257 RepID=A0ABP9RYC0_9GAMM
MTEAVIQARGLVRKFGDFTAIDGLDLTVEPGIIYGFLGPNGSGKTTAIRLLTGLLAPTEGEVTVLGHRLPQAAEALKREIGYMTQRFSLYGDLTVRENLKFMARIHGLSGSETRRRIDELLAVYGLDRLTGQLAGSMSGGQRQRLALAAAVLHRPRLLFLDEPTSAVDPENRRDFWEQLFDLCAAGASILVSTHYMDEAERCHKLAILQSGRKRADDAPQALMASMGGRVVELAGADLRQVKQQLISLPQVRSAAQLGSRLRILVDRQQPDPVAWLLAQPGCEGLHDGVEVRPSLEDVFVMRTAGARRQ